LYVHDRRLGMPEDVADELLGAAVDDLGQLAFVLLVEGELGCIDGDLDRPARSA
jgi:hypothetical protein